MTDNIQPTEQTPPATPATGTGAGQQPGKPAEPTGVTFTQEDVNRMMRDRVKETKESERANLLKELGVTNVDEAKTATTEYKKFQDAQLTAQQKLERDLAAQTEARQKVESVYQKTLIENAALKAFVGQVAPDRQAIAIKALDYSKVSVDKDGNVLGVADAIKALLQENPFLAPSEAAPATPSDKKKAPPIDPTNPASQQPGANLDWYKPAQKNNNAFSRGGIRPPPGEDR